MSVCRRFLQIFLFIMPVVLIPGCGHDQQLVSITIEPSTQTFGAGNIPVDQDAGLNVHLRALGTYIHPPVTKDITTQVTWTSNTPQMVTVDASGVLTATGMACGNALVSATVNTNKSAGDISSSGAIVTGTMTANVVCFTGSGVALIVNFGGTGKGTVTSTPPGLNCDTSCGTLFTSGSTVILTATPDAGSTFGSWSTGCDTVSGGTCTINSLTTPLTLTVTFN